MTIDREIEYLRSLLRELLRLPKETEWVEFKRNNDDPMAIGEFRCTVWQKECLYVVGHQ